jgi:peroxiredoxin
LKEIQSTGVTLVGISYDSVDVLKRFTVRQKIEFLLLSDPGSKTIVAYDLLNKEATGKGEGIPHPLTMLVGTDGVIKAKLGFEGYRTRHDAEDLQKAVLSLKTD